MKQTEQLLHHCKRLEEIYKRYCCDLVSLEKEVRDSVCQYAYGLGGAVFHRGYFLPSPTWDILISNATRGRLVKRESGKIKYNYRYGFNKNKRLILVECYGELLAGRQICETELLFYSENSILSVEYQYHSWSDAPLISQVGEAVYEENRIISYLRGFFYPRSQHCHSFLLEEYTYEGDRLLESNSTEYQKETGFICGHTTDNIINRRILLKYNENYVSGFDYQENSFLRGKTFHRNFSNRVSKKKSQPRTGMPVLL